MPPLPEVVRPEPSRPRVAVAHAWLSSVDYEKLELAAVSRGMHPDRLAASILENVLRGAEDGGFLEF